MQAPRVKARRSSPTSANERGSSIGSRGTVTVTLDQHLVKIDLDQFDEFVAPANAPRPSRQQVEGDERPPASSPGAQRMELDLGAGAGVKDGVDPCQICSRQGVVHQPGGGASHESHPGHDDVAGDCDRDQRVKRLPALDHTQGFKACV